MFDNVTSPVECSICRWRGKRKRKNAFSRPCPCCKRDAVLLRTTWSTGVCFGTPNGIKPPNLQWPRHKSPRA